MTKAHPALAAVAVAALASAAWAELPANPDPATVKVGRYTVETAHTRVGFSVSHMGFTTWSGDFSGVTGSLNLDPRSLADSRLDVTIPAASIMTTNAKVDEALCGADWFDAKQYPVIAFHATKVTPTGALTADVTGDLSFHGVTKSVTLKASFNGAGVNPLRKTFTVGFEATGEIRRSDFGVRRSLSLIGDEVQLHLSAAFERTP